jgi:hypothetical protein
MGSEGLRKLELEMDINKEKELCIPLLLHG